MDTNNIQSVLVIGLATAAISLTTSKARIFAPIREWVATKSSWFGELVSCFYCTSHWVAITFVVIYHPRLVHAWTPLDLVISVFSVVAIAAMVSAVVIRLTSISGSTNSEEIKSLRAALSRAYEVIDSQQKVINRSKQ